MKPVFKIVLVCVLSLCLQWQALAALGVVSCPTTAQSVQNADPAVADMGDPPACHLSQDNADAGDPATVLHAACAHCDACGGVWPVQLHHLTVFSLQAPLAAPVAWVPMANPSVHLPLPERPPSA